MTTMENEEVITVPPIEEMTHDHFIKHFNLRHSESLGGMTELPPDMYEDMIWMYRSFHARLHQTRVGLTHKHRGEDHG